MLKERLIATLRFFDLQDYPPTLLELHKYLIADAGSIRTEINNQWELVSSSNNNDHNSIGIHEILKCLDECVVEVGSVSGFYFLKGREALAEKRLQNYLFGLQREKRIKKYAYFLRFIPFVRGVGLSGSQALGAQKESSDIDLFIVTHPDFLWLARTLVTGYFQIIGKRRYSKKIANRFCLNHYIAAPKEVGEYKNLYTASEYLKLRPLVYASAIQRFVLNNKAWISRFFPNAEFSKSEMEQQSIAQKSLERLFHNSFGRFLEQKLKNWQLPKIRVQEKFIVVKDDELSFHPDSKQERLLTKFFENAS